MSDSLFALVTVRFVIDCAQVRACGGYSNSAATVIWVFAASPGLPYAARTAKMPAWMVTESLPAAATPSYHTGLLQKNGRQLTWIFILCLVDVVHPEKLFELFEKGLDEFLEGI
jgi:hypothetical protein